MERELNSKEQKVIELFSKVGLSRVNASQVSLGGSKDLYNIKKPLIFKIGSTNNLLVFGEIVKSMSFDQIREWLETQMKNNKDIRNNAEETPEVDGDAEPEVEDEIEGEDKVEEDNSNIKEEDVKFIMDQTKISREDALGYLKKANYDVFAALVEINKNN